MRLDQFVEIYACNIRIIELFSGLLGGLILPESENKKNFPVIQYASKTYDKHYVEFMPMWKMGRSRSW